MKDKEQDEADAPTLAYGNEEEEDIAKGDDDDDDAVAATQVGLPP